MEKNKLYILMVIVVSLFILNFTIVKQNTVSSGFGEYSVECNYGPDGALMSYYCWVPGSYNCNCPSSMPDVGE